jgi:hypothetical protein
MKKWHLEEQINFFDITFRKDSELCLLRLGIYLTKQLGNNEKLAIKSVVPISHLCNLISLPATPLPNLPTG